MDVSLPTSSGCGPPVMFVALTPFVGSIRGGSGVVRAAEVTVAFKSCSSSPFWITAATDVATSSSISKVSAVVTFSVVAFSVPFVWTAVSFVAIGGGLPISMSKVVPCELVCLFLRVVSLTTLTTLILLWSMPSKKAKFCTRRSPKNSSTVTSRVSETWITGVVSIL